MEENPTQNFDTFEVFGRSYDLPLLQSGGALTKEKILMESTVLFATQGYASISIRDIADKVYVTPGALYNHFRSKEELFDAILTHSCDLYMIYFKHMEEDLLTARCFEDVLDILFAEALEMRNTYTNYAFSLIIVEQLRDKRAGEIYNEVFLGYGAAFIEKWFNISIENAWAKSFSVMTEARSILQTVMFFIMDVVSKSRGNESKFDYREMLLDIKVRLLDSYCISSKSSNKKDGRVV
ncbi:MAG: TetR/AcrR family transcriptional regulator [Clostridiales Family XIII bacterium]|jgi:AcrR family transcriptional regulator|nr:TetR/AcrR family transcriptional regulator [Clostridiales Family XIII bacterium]